jgi:hypothetical protein
MRFIAFVLLGLILGGPAAAQNWQEYSYADNKFSLMFPAAPRIEAARHEVAEGRSVPARVYSVRQGRSELTMIVADLANTGLDETTVIDHAVKRLTAGREVVVNYPHRIYQVYGRQLSTKGPDGSRTSAAVFNVLGKVYQIEAKVLPGSDELDLVRFQQSLSFEREVANRTEAEVRAIRESCPGRRDAPFPPGGADDPRCSLAPGLGE